MLRAGEPIAVWVPDEHHEAMRDLVRARAAAVEVRRVHRQQARLHAQARPHLSSQEKLGDALSARASGENLTTPQIKLHFKEWSK